MEQNNLLVEALAVELAKVEAEEKEIGRQLEQGPMQHHEPLTAQLRKLMDTHKELGPKIEAAKMADAELNLELSSIKRD